MVWRCSDIIHKIRHLRECRWKWRTLRKGLPEKSNPRIMIENESGKSSKLGSLASPISAHLGCYMLAWFDAVEIPDTPAEEINATSFNRVFRQSHGGFAGHRSFPTGA